MSIPPGATVGFFRTVVDPGNTVYTVWIAGRAATPADRGRSSWPRVTSLSGRELVVTSATLWLGTEADRDRSPNIVWTFHPIVRSTDAGHPVALGLTAHVLELAGLKWGHGGPRQGARRSYRTMLDYLEAVAELTAKAKREGWDLRDTRAHPAETIANELGLSLRQVHRENRRAQIAMDDIRRGAVTGTYCQMRSVLLEPDPDP